MKKVKETTGAKWDDKTITSDDIINGIDLMEYYINISSENQAYLERDFLLRKIAENTGGCYDPVVGFNYQDYELHINLYGMVRSLYNKITNEYICSYKVVYEVERNGSEVTFIMKIKEIASVRKERR